MVYALINEKDVVVEVSATTFDVHESLRWVKIPEGISANVDDTYDAMDGNFTPREVPPFVTELKPLNGISIKYVFAQSNVNIDDLLLQLTTLERDFINAQLTSGVNLPRGTTFINKLVGMSNIPIDEFDTNWRLIGDMV